LVKERIMNCHDIQEHLSDYLGGELTAEPRIAFDDHLRECSECRAEVQSLDGALAAMIRLDAAPAPIAFPRRRRFMSAPFAYAAVLLFGIGLGWVMKPTDDRVRSSHLQDIGSIRLVSAGGVDGEWFRSFDTHRSTLFTRNLAAFARGLRAGPVQ
jgi:anti-sigma factor RsiW